MPDEEKPITKPYQLRDLSNLTRAYDYDPAEITKHRRVIIDSTPEELERIDKAVSTEKISSSRDFEHLVRTFPNYKKAIWVFERAPREKNIDIFHAQKIYRNHIEVRYTLDGETEPKGVILKDTRYARMERMMCQIAKAGGLPSYKVLPVDGTSKGGGYYEILDTGERKHYEEGFILPIERVVPILPSQYAVIETVKGSTVEDYRGKLRGIVPESDRQRAFFQSLGKNYAADFVLACVDEKDEHLIIDYNSMEMTRIDREQSLRWFSEDFYEPLAYGSYGSSLSIEEQTTAFRTGVGQFTGEIRANWDKVQEIFRRNINFGITGKDGKVEPLLPKLIGYQLDRMDAWVKDNS